VLTFLTRPGYIAGGVDKTWGRPWPGPWCRPWPTLWPTIWPTGGQIFKNINKTSVRVEGGIKLYPSWFLGLHHGPAMAYPTFCPHPIAGGKMACRKMSPMHGTLKAGVKYFKIKRLLGSTGNQYSRK